MEQKQKDQSLVLQVEANPQGFEAEALERQLTANIVNITSQKKGRRLFGESDKDNRMQKGVFIILSFVFIISFFVGLYLKVTLFR